MQFIKRERVKRDHKFALFGVSVATNNINLYTALEDSKFTVTHNFLFTFLCNCVPIGYHF